MTTMFTPDHEWINIEDHEAAVVGIPGRKKALAMVVDCTPRYVQAHPETGGRQAVAEAWRNITAVGARPLAVTDNMNFGNPQKPEIMGQFAGAIMGMAEACTAFTVSTAPPTDSATGRATTAPAVADAAPDATTTEATGISDRAAEASLCAWAALPQARPATSSA